MECLWFEDGKNINDVTIEPSQLNKETNLVIEKGNKFRKENGYYSSSSFYYEGESYWGLDRLNHLEDRLIDLGLKSLDTYGYLADRKSNIQNYSTKIGRASCRERV